MQKQADTTFENITGKTDHSKQITVKLKISATENT